MVKTCCRYRGFQCGAEYAFGFIGCDTSKTAYATRFTMKNVVVSGVDYLAFSIKYPNRLDNVIVVSDLGVVKEVSDSVEDKAVTAKVIRYSTNDGLFTALESENVLANWDSYHISYANQVIYFNGKAIIIGQLMNIAENEAVIGSTTNLTVQGDVTIALKEAISGVTLNGNALTVADSVKEGTRVTLVATASSGVTKEFVVVCHRSYTDAALGAMDAEVGADAASMVLTGMDANVECIFYGESTAFEGFSVADGVLTISKKLLDSMYKQFGLGEHTIYLGTDASVRYAIKLTIATKIINTVEDLKSIATDEATLEGYYILNTDLDCTGETIALLAGAQSTYDSANIPGVGFKGIFDGRGHIISNLTTFNGGYRQLGGVFGQLCAGSVVKNVAFVNLTSEKTYLLVGDGAVLHGIMENVVVISADHAKIPLTSLTSVAGKLNNCFFANVKQISANGSAAVVTNVLSVTTDMAFNGGFADSGGTPYKAVPNYATMDALYVALDANNILESWENALLTYEDGKLYFGGTPLFFEEGTLSDPVSLGDMQSGGQNVMDVPAEIIGNVIAIEAEGTGRLISGVKCADGKLTLSEQVSQAIAAGAEGTEISLKLYTDKGLYYNVSALAVTKIITNAAELKSIAVSGNTLDGYYVLANDIDCNQEEIRLVTAWSNLETTGFIGTFDGRGYTISNVSVAASGLFNCTGNGIIKDLALVNVSGTDKVLATEVHGTTIENVFVSSDSCLKVFGYVGSSTIKDMIAILPNGQHVIQNCGNSGNPHNDIANLYAVIANPTCDPSYGTAVSGIYYYYYLKDDPKTLYNLQHFTVVQELLSAMGESDMLDGWNGSFSFADGKLYFGDTVVVE